MPAPSLTKALKPPDTKAALRRWTPGALRLLLATLRAHLYTETEDVKIAELMDLETADYNALKAEMYAQDKAHISGQTAEDVFIDYRIRQEGVIRDLDTVAKNDKTPAAAVVGALRAKSDIIDKVILRGQEFGLIDKVPEKKMVVAGVLVASLPMNDLRSMILKQTKGLESLLKKYGDGDMAEEIDVTPALPAARTASLPAKGAARPTIEGESVEEPSPEALPVPKFSDLSKTGKATGGILKSKGGKATVANRVKAAPTMKAAE